MVVKEFTKRRLLRAKEFVPDPISMLQEFRVRKLEAHEVSERAATEISSLATQLCERPITLTIEDVRRTTRAHHFAVAIIADERETRIVGMACLVVMHLPQGIRVLVESVCVDESCRGQGIGKALIDEMIAISATLGAPHLSLTCNPTRDTAYEMYRSQGFEKADTSVYRRRL